MTTTTLTSTTRTTTINTSELTSLLHPYLHPHLHLPLASLSITSTVGASTAYGVEPVPSTHLSLPGRRSHSVVLLLTALALSSCVMDPRVVMMTTVSLCPFGRAPAGSSQDQCHTVSHNR